MDSTMIRPLTRRKRDHSLYFRKPAVEATLAELSRLHKDELLRRARLRDPQNPDLLSSEALVYFIRNARRDGDEHLATNLLEQLTRRCQRILNRKVDNNFPDAEDIRQSVITDLHELFLRDFAGSQLPNEELDFYEVAFNQAFRALRIDTVRRATAKLVHQVPLPDEDDVEAKDLTSVHELASALSADPTQDFEATQVAALERAIEQLPPNLKTTIKLVYFWGLPIESTKGPSVASKLGISDRAVRKRVKNALLRLRTLMENDNG